MCDNNYWSFTQNCYIVVHLLIPLQLCGRTIRVDHVNQYRRPKDEGGNEIVEKGCAPKTPTPIPSSSPSPSPEPVKDKGEKVKKTKDKQKRRKHKSKKKQRGSSESDLDEHRSLKDKIRNPDKESMEWENLSRGDDLESEGSPKKNIIQRIRDKSLSPLRDKPSVGAHDSQRESSLFSHHTRSNHSRYRDRRSRSTSRSQERRRRRREGSECHRTDGSQSRSRERSYSRQSHKRV